MYKRLVSGVILSSVVITHTSTWANEAFIKENLIKNKSQMTAKERLIIYGETTPPAEIDKTTKNEEINANEEIETHNNLNDANNNNINDIYYNQESAAIKKEIIKYVDPPKWENYVPQRFVDPKPGSKGWKITELVFGIILTELIFTSPIGIPMVVHSINRLREISWYKKKNKFEAGLEEALTIDDPQERKDYYKQLLRRLDMSRERSATWD